MNPKPLSSRGMRHPQRGVVMLFGLIALAIMLIGAAAMVRSVNTAMFNSGNLGFKRDMANQMERALEQVRLELVNGALATDAARQTNLQAQNYSATLLASNAQGIPTVLLADNATFAATNTAPDIVVAGQELEIRYVIDRLCANTGAPDDSQCTMANDPIGRGGGLRQMGGAAQTTAGGAGAVSKRVIYRVSVRVKGPRNTQAFYQSTMTL